MKIEVYEGTPTSEKVLRLKLEPGYDSVKLVAVDAEGKELSCGVILLVNSKGIDLWRGPNVGLPVDKHDRVVLI